MWISKDEWEALNIRIENLERRLDRGIDYKFVLYDPAYSWGAYITPWRDVPHQEIHIKDVIQFVLRKLDIELQYVGNKEGCVKLAEKEPPSGSDSAPENK